MTIDLATAISQRLAATYPDAVDCRDEKLMEFNRNLDTRLMVENEPASILSQHKFEQTTSPWQVAHHAWYFGPLVCLRARLEVSHCDDVDLSEMRLTAELDQKFPAFDQQLRAWGTCRYFKIDNLWATDSTTVQATGMFLVDPLTLNLIVPDDRGRATIRGTRFRVAQLVEIQEMLKSDLDGLRDQLYDQLSLQQLHAAFAYWHAHREEVQQTILDEQETTERYQRQQAIIAGGA